MSRQGIQRRDEICVVIQVDGAANPEEKQTMIQLPVNCQFSIWFFLFGAGERIFACDV